MARALPPQLLCDEPTSALDPELAQVVAVLRQLASEGTTMLIATHDLRLAAQIAQQVVFLEAGEVVEAGSARQMFTTPSGHVPSNTSPPSPSGCRRAGASSRFWLIESDRKTAPHERGCLHGCLVAAADHTAR